MCVPAVRSGADDIWHAQRGRHVVKKVFHHRCHDGQDRATIAKHPHSHYRPDNSHLFLPVADRIKRVTVVPQDGVADSVWVWGRHIPLLQVPRTRRLRGQ